MKVFNKGEFFTVEAFRFEVEDGEVVEEERNEDIDTFWHSQMSMGLMEFVLSECRECLGEGPTLIDLSPRTYAELDDNGELEDYGDTCMGTERYIWTGEELTPEEEYLESL